MLGYIMNYNVYDLVLRFYMTFYILTIYYIMVNNTSMEKDNMTDQMYKEMSDHFMEELKKKR